MARRYVNPNRTDDDALLELQAWAEEDRWLARRQDAAGTAGGYQPRAVVTREARVYNPGTDSAGALFLSDIVRAYAFADSAAQQRLARHMQEERVERGQWLERASAGTAQFSGMVVPNYLTSLYSLAVAAGRPFADICTRHDLPATGMSVTVPAETTGAAAGAQAGGENSAAPSQTPVYTPTTENVLTAAGSLTLSRQLVDRSAAAVEVTLADLLLRQATNLDSTLINAAVFGLNALATVVTYTDASPTAQKAYSKILAAAAGVKAALKSAGNPTHAIMTSARWWWLNEPGTSWPMITGQGQAQADRGGPAAAAVSGVLPCGLAVVSDDAVPSTLGVGTNQDRVFVVSAGECHLWEAAGPEAGQVFIRAETPAAASLGVQLTAWSYYAACFRRYASAVQAVDGSGLVMPVFA
jgi:hypothetical protein